MQIKNIMLKGKRYLSGWDMLAVARELWILVGNRKNAEANLCE